MRITAPHGSADGAWLALRLALWPDASEAEQLSRMTDAETERVVYFRRGLHDA